MSLSEVLLKKGNRIAADDVAAPVDELVIEADRGDRHYWRDIWRYRELFQVLAWRDISVRYRQTLIGAAWAMIRPFLTMVVLTVVFHTLAKLPADGSAPYALMVFAGILPWSLFAAGLSDTSNSVLANADLIGKVYFPRLIVPAAKTIVALVDFLVSFLILLVLMVWYHYAPDARILLLPMFVFVGVLAGLGPGLWLAALNVKYRDVGLVIPFLTQLGLYVSPVGFSSSLVPEQWRLLYALNPMVGVIDGFRWALLRGSTPIYWTGFCLSLLVAGCFLWLGITQFRRVERTFADLI